MSDQVVLLHGLGRSCASVARLQSGLEEMGFAALCWSYPSRRRRLAGHIEAFREWLRRQAFAGPVHFVGHSLGGIIIRGALADTPPVAIGRIVMIASPNQGAGVVSRFGRWPFSRAIFGLPLQDLGEKSPALMSLGVPEAEIGIIAGLRHFHPLNAISYVNLFHRAGHQHDGTVELANTQLEGATDSIAIDAHHTFICDHDEVIAQTGAFLRNGQFSR
ncbi:MAG: alpha/beta fold hydrolase [Rhodospirillaceae bacterium]|jgi:pimeloyl-ACP methyl ester carboxylesterase|nr:alpha/beta fold hydrolase [Rhodospirillaceae bacterium]MBT3491367.1 alpha/beta fold hydrolase [Rhodospirillaceae bacterium]MBT3782890.1 alpha/beta fold hydrolase [Rhodospirillaceae bacterium]MBT3977881.1 alpha/beta fold hydrolase [Rhodospirillaceae bacterium]MBT4166947.1 alpha/beta fold hydrolase [Rhodospirillaceae bacterium]